MLNAKKELSMCDEGAFVVYTMLKILSVHVTKKTRVGDVSLLSCSHSVLESFCVDIMLDLYYFSLRFVRVVYS